MPANLTPEYLAAEQRYKAAKEPAEKLVHLQEMLRVIPKHKGTDHMQGDIKRKISKLKTSLETKSGTKRTFDYAIPKEGAGQVLLVGPPNAGKSSLIAALTNADPEVAPYPFTTIKPQPAMMPFEDALVQLIDAPAVCNDFYQTWMNGLIRNADLNVAVFDASSDSIVDDFISLREILAENRIRLDSSPADRFTEDGKAWKKTIFAANKIDQPNARSNLSVFSDLIEEIIEFIYVDAVSGNGIEDLRRLIWDTLEVIRIYTKTPGKPVDMHDPVILPKGSTVMKFARTIHKDFAKKLNYARIWGSTKYDGLRVPRDHVLSDQDVVELHIS